MKLKEKYGIALDALETIDSFYKGESYKNPRLVLRTALNKLKKPKTTIIRRIKNILWTTTTNIPKKL